MRLHSKELGLSGRLGVPKLGIVGGLLVLLMLVAAACDDKAQPTGPTATQGSPGTGAQTQQVATPTTTSTPQLPGSIKPVPASESYRLDLGAGVVVAFVEGLSAEQPDKVAYVTHVPSGSQAMLDRDGQIIDRHDGRGDGPGRLDAVLEDGAEMDRILKGLKSDEDVRPRETVIDWVPLIQFGGIHYLARWRLAGQATREGDRDLTAEDLGPEFYRIAFRGDGYVGAAYRYQDGDSTYLNPGTPVYAVKGYSPEFRLATLEEGRVRLFESDTNPLARTGEDLLDIRGKVKAVDVLSTKSSIKVLGTKAEDGEDLVLGTINEVRAIERFVEMVLDSPVDQGNRDREGPRYFLSFHLADGTSVGRTLWLESGELSRGIMTDPVVTLFVWSALGDEHRPAVTDGGPRISERLAARLGLAYLGFAVPEIVATGKPHSPVVRLMRGSEFQAMRMSNPRATDTDPLVWVVEAQGSWRQAGIVPKEKRQDFSVGLVTFDADTGRRYGTSHVNTSLLGTGGDARPITLSVTPTPSPTALAAEYSAVDLAAWYEDVKDTVWQIPGIAWTDLSKRRNRIEIGLRPLRGVRERFEAALGTLEVPRQAIEVEVGCERVIQWPDEVGEASEDSFLRSFAYSLDVVSQVPYGGTVRMKLTLQNVTNEQVKVALGGKPAYDFVLTTSDGEGVWNWKCGRITLDVLGSETLEPGEKLEFIGEWEQVDNRGEPVPPGTYLVRGVLNFGQRNVVPVGMVVTAALEMEVLQ